MFSRKSKILLFTAGALCALPVLAVDFGVMEAADTVEPRDFKFIAYPLAVRNSPRHAQNSGIAVGLGYGIIPNLDIEGQMATYDDITYYGGDAEYTFLNRYNVEASVSSGARFAHSDFGTQRSLDLTHIATYTLPADPRFKFNGALDLAYNDPDSRYSQTVGIGDRYVTAYFAPGAQMRITRNVDVIGELGFGLNGHSDDYAGAGLSYYFR
jgi:hypothetical protein